MSSKYVLDMEAKVFTLIQAKTEKTLKETYPNIKYTTNDEVVEPVTIFPTVYIHELSSIPVGNDLEAEGINGVNTTFEVRVTSTSITSGKVVTSGRSVAKDVMNDIMEAFLSLHFYSVSNPIITSNNNMYIANARFRRIVGANDTLP